jgi:predicted MPP superfamily phosphohydrolase
MSFGQVIHLRSIPPIMGARKWYFLILTSLLLFFSSTSLSSTGSPVQQEWRRGLIEVEGAPGSVVWVVQLSDLHFSVFHPDRAGDFRRYVGPTLSMINPSLVLITGDLTGLFTDFNLETFQSILVSSWDCLLEFSLCFLWFDLPVLQCAV